MKLGLVQITDIEQIQTVSYVFTSLPAAQQWVLMQIEQMEVEEGTDGNHEVLRFLRDAAASLDTRVERALTLLPDYIEYEIAEVPVLNAQGEEAGS